MNHADVEVGRIRLAHSGIGNAVIDLFLFGLDVDIQRAEDALAPLGVEPLRQAGLVDRDERSVRALVSFIPYEELFLAGDRLDVGQTDVEGRVPNTDLSTRLLDCMTIRRPVGSLLDLGTGTGVQALRGARHAERVIAVDANPRALAFARFNAALNGRNNVEFRQGSWLEPVAGERFDLVVANPPFIISPLSDDPHRYSGQPGDELCRQLVRSLPDHLDEGGVAHVLCDWVHRSAEDPFARLEPWVAGSGCDALLLYVSSDDALTYAITYRDERGEASALEGVTRWFDYYLGLGIEFIASGVVVLRRRADASNWTRRFKLEGYPGVPAGDQLLQLFAASDYLQSAGRDRLLGANLALVPGHRVDQRLTREGAAYRAHEAVLRLGPLPLPGTVSPEALRVLFDLDGTNSLAAVLGATADEFEIDVGELTGRLLPELEELVARGLLRPTG